MDHNPEAVALRARRGARARDLDRRSEWVPSASAWTSGGRKPLLPRSRWRQTGRRDGRSRSRCDQRRRLQLSAAVQRKWGRRKPLSPAAVGAAADSAAWLGTPGGTSWPAGGRRTSSPNSWWMQARPVFISIRDATDGLDAVLVAGSSLRRTCRPRSFASPPQRRPGARCRPRRRSVRRAYPSRRDSPQRPASPPCNTSRAACNGP